MLQSGSFSWRPVKLFRFGLTKWRSQSQNPTVGSNGKMFLDVCLVSVDLLKTYSGWVLIPTLETTTVDQLMDHRFRSLMDLYHLDSGLILYKVLLGNKNLLYLERFRDQDWNWVKSNQNPKKNHERPSEGLENCWSGWYRLHKLVVWRNRQVLDSGLHQGLLEGGKELDCWCALVLVRCWSLQVMISSDSGQFDLIIVPEAAVSLRGGGGGGGGMCVCVCRHHMCKFTQLPFCPTDLKHLNPSNPLWLSRKHIFLAPPPPVIISTGHH